MEKANKKLNKGFTQLVDFGDAIELRAKSASPKLTTGFTIIETMISIGLFVIIVVFGTGALLNANLVHNKTEDQRSIMDNLSFIMEDMSRNLRTGYNYRCYDTEIWIDSQDPQIDSLDDPLDCFDGGVIVFEEAHGDGAEDATNDQWVYRIWQDSVNPTKYNIEKSTNGGLTFVQMNLEEITIKDSSGFDVIGAKPPIDGDFQQPLIKIHLIGEIKYKDIITPFSLQTTVSQRLIDVENAP